MSEAPLDSPSVFNFFPPDYNIPGTSLLGPEFDLETTATTLVRANFVNSFVYGSIGDGYHGEFHDVRESGRESECTGQLLDSLNALLLHGTMSSRRARQHSRGGECRSGGHEPESCSAPQAAIYLILSSSQYQVEH